MGSKDVKGKKKVKSGRKPKLRKIAEGLHPSEMSRSQLMAFIKRLKSEVEQEQKERNLFLLEKQKLFAMWNLTMDRIKILKDETTHSLDHLDKSKQAKTIQDGVESQKLRYLQNEELKNFAMVRLNHLNYMRHVSDEIWSIENFLRESSLFKKSQIRHQMRVQYEILRGFHIRHADELHTMVMTMSRSMRDKKDQLERQFDRRREECATAMQEKFDIMNTIKMSEMDRRNQLHDKAMLDLKTFFNDMAVNNYAVLGTLQDEVDELKMRNNRLRRDLKCAKKFYYIVVHPLEKMQRELEIFDGHFDTINTNNGHQDNHELKFILTKKKECITNMGLLVETLLNQIEIAEKDRDQVRQECVRGFMKLQEQQCMKNMVTQLKIKAAHRDLQLLKAFNASTTMGNHGPLDSLYSSHELKERTVKSELRTFHQHQNEIETDCKKNNKNIYGLQHKQIYHQETASQNSKLNYYCLQKFRGQQQQFNSHIQYRGVVAGGGGGGAAVAKKQNPGKNLGYGYYYSDLPEFKSTPTSSNQYPPPPVKCPEDRLHLPPISSNNNKIPVGTSYYYYSSSRVPQQHQQPMERPSTSKPVESTSRSNINRLVSQTETRQRLQTILRKKLSYSIPINVNE